MAKYINKPKPKEGISPNKVGKSPYKTDPNTNKVGKSPYKADPNTLMNLRGHPYHVSTLVRIHFKYFHPIYDSPSLLIISMLKN